MTRNMPNLFIFVTPFGRNYVVEWLGERIGRRELPPEFLEVKGRLFQVVALVALRDQVVKFRQLGGFAVKVKMFFFVTVRAVNRQSKKAIFIVLPPFLREAVKPLPVRFPGMSADSQKPFALRSRL